MFVFHLLPYLLFILTTYKNQGFSFFAFAAFILFCFLSVFGSGALVRTSYLKKKFTYKEAVALMKKRYWSYIGFNIVFALYLFGLFILLIIPGIIFLVYWSMAHYIYLGENKKIGESLKASRAAVTGNWWRVFGYYLVILLLYIAVTLILELILPSYIVSATLAVLTSPFLIFFGKHLYLELKTKKSFKSKKKFKQI